MDLLLRRRVLLNEQNSYMTTLYTDGTFIINENLKDREKNVTLHGAVVNEYTPLSKNNQYEFLNPTSIPWYSERKSIKSVKFGSEIKPTSLTYWFISCSQMTSFDSTNLNTSNVTGIISMFSGCSSLISLDLSSFDTSKVTDMWSMFDGCSSLTSLDLSSFNTSNVTDMSSMFDGCSNLITIYVSTDFVVTQVTSSSNMFSGCTSLVGGAGTTYNANYTNKIYARIDNQPTQPGYFTNKNL